MGGLGAATLAEAVGGVPGDRLPKNNTTPAAAATPIPSIANSGARDLDFGLFASPTMGESVRPQEPTVARLGVMRWTDTARDWPLASADRDRRRSDDSENAETSVTPSTRLARSTCS